ncbi:MAG: hypothetical protein AB7H90_01265 [Alphaproteobacteria bacterium]
MPKAATKIAEISPFHNVADGALADMHGQIGAEIAALEARRKAIAAEMISRGINHAEGALFHSTVVAETMVASLDRKAIEEAMGEAWTTRFLKWTKRAACIRTAPRALAAA